MDGAGREGWGGGGGGLDGRKGLEEGGIGDAIYNGGDIEGLEEEEKREIREEN